MDKPYLDPDSSKEKNIYLNKKIRKIVGCQHWIDYVFIIVRGE